MYTITRNHVVEDLHLEDNGKTLDLHVDLNVDAILQRYAAAAKALSDAQKATQSGLTEERVTALGEAILGIFEVIFGEKQAEQLVEFYDGAYTEMLADVAPFVNDVVAPKINEAQQRIMQKYQNVKRFHK
jgi:hypothetical protein